MIIESLMYLFFSSLSLSDISVGLGSLLGWEEVGFVLWSERLCIFTLFRILTGHLYL